MAEKEVTVRINVEGVSNEASEIAKLEVQLKNLKEVRSDLIKQASAPGHFASNEEKLKIAAVNREINEQTTKQKELKKIVDTMPDSVQRMRAEYIKLKDEYYKVDAAQREKMVPGIQKLYLEITKAENAVGVFSRNVGNYKDAFGQAGTAVSSFSGAIGGAAGEIGNVTSSIMTATSPVGIFTALVGGLAMAWQRVKENVNLYLESADKLRYGFAGYEQDASKAQIDARRRANGQITVARASLTEANRILDFAGSTEDQKADARLMAEQAKMMIAEGEAFRDQVVGIKDKITWTLKYNKLLQEAEDIDDRRKEKAIEWKKLDAEFIEQRKIATDQSSTTLQIQQATARAEEIANKLLTEKKGLLDEQIKNIEAIGELTFTQEEVEDQVRGLKEEQNEIQAQYESAGIRINKMERTAAKETKTELEEEKKLRSDILGLSKELSRVAEDVRKKSFDNFADLANKNANPNQISKGIQKILGISDKDLGLQKMNADAQKTAQTTSGAADDQEIKDTKSKEDKILAIKQAALQGAQAGADAAFQAKRSRLQAEMEAELSNVSLTEQQKTAIRKKYAKEQQRADVTQAIINGALAVGNALATTKPFMPMAIIAAALAAAQTGIQVATIKAAKYNTGGKINAGIPVHTGTADNLLIAVNNREAVINERQIARLGGSGAMRRAGVPGFATGGAVGNMPYINPSVPAQDSTMAGVSERLKNIEVFIDIHKVRSALNETEIILQPQKI